MSRESTVTNQTEVKVPAVNEAATGAVTVTEPPPEEVDKKAAKKAAKKADGEKKRKSPYRWEQKLHEMRAAIANSLGDPQVLDNVRLYNFDQARLQTFAGMVDNAERLHHEQQNKKAEQLESTRDATDKRQKVLDRLTYFIDLARLMFKDKPGIIDLLGLNGIRRKDFGGWYQQGKKFYDNALSRPEILAEYARHSVSQQDLETGRQELMDAQTASIRKLNANADAQKNTDVKILGDKEVSAWWSEYIKVVRIALKKDPQLMEKVGIVVPTRK
jgi:hypothetical protein